MNILDLCQSFQTDEQAIDHLEKVRWHGHPVCPYCKSENIGQHVSGDRGNRRWQCRECTRAFSVTVGTLFHGTHMKPIEEAAGQRLCVRDAAGQRRPPKWPLVTRLLGRSLPNMTDVVAEGFRWR